MHSNYLIALDIGFVISNCWKKRSHTQAYLARDLVIHITKRLEFLGDTVLNMIISEILFFKFPRAKEGELAKRRAYLVCGKTLTAIARNLNIGHFIIMTAGEKKSGGQDNDNNLENTMEAIIASIYLDGNITAAKDFVSKHWSELIKTHVNVETNPKILLQEKAQKSGMPIPLYKIQEKFGKEHDPTFIVSVSLNDKHSTGTGKNRKLAEQDAAQNFIKTYNIK